MCYAVVGWSVLCMSVDVVGLCYSSPLFLTDLSGGSNLLRVGY